MNRVTRRTLLHTGAMAAATSVIASPSTKMTISLSAGSIGVKADQLQAIEYAHRFGYQAVEADSGYIKTLPDDGIKKLADDLRSKNLVWGTSGLPVEFRRAEEDFKAGMADLPARAAALRKAGERRMSTWLSPSSDALTARENFDLHVARLGPIVRVLGEHDIRLGLEYVGPKTLWASKRFPFVHTMKEMKELIRAVGQPNLGLVLDSWHWYTAGETTADLLALKPSEIISVDLNDAPAGIPVEQQIDSQRELPCATGVIDVAGFLNALNKIGCDAPVRCEPFNAALRKLPPEQALETTIQAMRQGFGKISS